LLDDKSSTPDKFECIHNAIVATLVVAFGKETNVFKRECLTDLMCGKHPNLRVVERGSRNSKSESTQTELVQRTELAPTSNECVHGVAAIEHNPKAFKTKIGKGGEQ